MPRQSVLNHRPKTRYLAPGDPTYALITKSNGYQSNNLLSGFPLQIIANTTRLSNGTTLYYTINGLLTTDIVGGSLSGSITITGNTGSVTILSVFATTTPSPKAFTVELRTDSISGTIVATSESLNFYYSPSNDYLPMTWTIVGGGGGGGSDFGGGGGCGGYYTGSGFYLRYQYHNIIIGAGGARGVIGNNGSRGGTSTWFPYGYGATFPNHPKWVATGGGGGGRYNSTNGIQGIGSGQYSTDPGGGGGGGGGGSFCGGGGLGASGSWNATYFPTYFNTPFQNIGGNCFAGGNYAGGGGGATGDGGVGPYGTGGQGVVEPITGNIILAGGGGGGCSGGTLNNGGSNGVGGSGAGAGGPDYTIYSTAGQVNTGSGGGGGGATGADAGLGGNGATGLFVFVIPSNYFVGVTSLTYTEISNVDGVKTFKVTAGSGYIYISGGP